MTEEVELPHDDAAHAAMLRGQRLEYLTIGWNVVEFVAATTLGVVAGSIGLLAFGLDTLVELFASIAVVWFIADHHKVRRAVRALRFVSIAFAVLAVYLSFAGLRALLVAGEAHQSLLGILVLLGSTITMFTLGILKRRVARESGSAPIRAEAMMTIADGCLALGVLIALVLDATVQWWWMDPAAALLVAGFCGVEAVVTWREATAHARMAF